MAKKKALVIQKLTSFVGMQDGHCVKSLYEEAGFEVDYIESYVKFEEEVDNLNIEEYTAIVLPPCINSLYESGKHRRSLYRKLKERAREGALTVYVSDVTFPLNFRTWDKGESHITDKINELEDVEMKVIGAFDESILSDESAMNFVNKKWMKEFPKGTFIPIQWLLFGDKWYIENYSKPKSSNSLFSLSFNGKYRYMYYGIEKSKLVKDLKDMGFGLKEDLCVGKMRAKFPECATVESNESGQWMNYLNNVEKVLIPYEPIKGDYQYTPRFTEARIHYKDKVLISDRISSNLKELFASEEFREKEKKKYAKKIADLY